MLRKSLYMFLIALLVVGAGCSGEKKVEEQPQARQEEQREVETPRNVAEENTPALEAGQGRYFSIRPENVQEYIAKGAQVIDVRTPQEFEQSPLGIIEGSFNIPLDYLYGEMDQLDEDTPYIIVCRTGNRSRKAARILVKDGFKYVYNLEGGMVAYRAQFPQQPDMDIKPGEGMKKMPSSPGWK